MKAWIVFAFSLFLVNCVFETESATSPNGDDPSILAKKASNELLTPIPVEPMFKGPSKKKGVSQTVFVYYGKGPKGGKPPKDPQTCSDPNTNQDHKALPFSWSAAGINAVYQPAFEPMSNAFGAIERGFTAWENAAGNSDLVNFSKEAGGNAGPELDGKNSVGWRNFIGRDARRVLAVTYTWADANDNIVESDIFYNLSQSWAVNKAITPGSTDCGKDFDVQGVGTHEIGHFLGLDHVSSVNDATMYPSAAKGELKIQTLTPGEVNGILAVAPTTVVF